MNTHCPVYSRWGLQLHRAPAIRAPNFLAPSSPTDSSFVAPRAERCASRPSRAMFARMTHPQAL